MAGALMLDHVSITVSDLARAARFYDAVMAALRVPCVWRDDDGIGYGARNNDDDDSHTYLTIRATDAASAADRRHWCYRAPDRAAVDAFHAAGLAQGGADDGASGIRPHYHAHYYAAFLLDPDGNRVEAVCHRATKADAVAQDEGMP
jgi:catechol 2,3-dioxygenase-like lactoylglutathione lyase family enzyme